MEYFMNRKNVDLYTKMMIDYDNKFIISKVNEILPRGSSLLELGMGTGVDLISLAERYNVIGSDSSLLFVDDFKNKSNIDVKVLDAVDINIDCKFDCIYSNKVMQHLSTEDFVKSLNNQYAHLSTNGIIFATLWVGKYCEKFEFEGMLRFVYYDEKTLKKLIPKDLELEQLIYYTEFELNDSMIIILRGKGR